MPIVADIAWRRITKEWLERLGLLAPAFRTWEVLKSLESKYSKRLYREGIGPDGLPVPPPRLVVSVGGHNNVEAFVEGGRLLATRITSLLARHGVNLNESRAVLDFGCGSGRIIRHLRVEHGTPALFGCDYNADAVAWCVANLTYARFTVNQALPPLPYGEAAFDVAYAFSVFTHFTEPMQVAWMREMARVVRSGGHLVVSVHGPTWSSLLTPAESEAFAAGQLVVRYGSVAGSNLCAAFHPVPFIHRMLNPHFDLLDVHSQPGDQDLLLLRRRPTPVTG